MSVNEDNYIIMSTLSCHVYEGYTDQNAPLLSKYRVDYLHISPYILHFSSITTPKVEREQ